MSIFNRSVVNEKRINAKNAREIAETPQKLAGLYQLIRESAEEGEPCVKVNYIDNWHVHNALSRDGFDITDDLPRRKTVIWWGYK